MSNIHHPIDKEPSLILQAPEEESHFKQRMVFQSPKNLQNKEMNFESPNGDDKTPDKEREFRHLIESLYNTETIDLDS
jgi:hypothetical protein